MVMEKFFDMVCQSKLIEILSRTMKESAEGLFERMDIVLLRGGSLSPSLCNIMLNELERENEQRGYGIVRYMVNCMIFYKNRKAAERTLANTVAFTEKKLFLKVNSDKTVVSRISNVNIWATHFTLKLADIKSLLLQRTNSAALNPCCLWEQWKKVKMRYKNDKFREMPCELRIRSVPNGTHDGMRARLLI